MSTRKRVVVALPSLVAVRDALLSGALKELRNHVDVEVMTPYVNDPDLVAELSALRIDAYDLPPTGEARWKSRLYQRLEALLAGAHLTHLARRQVKTVLIEQSALRTRDPFRFYRNRIAADVLTKVPGLREAMRRLADNVLDLSYYEGRLASARADLMLVYDVFHPAVKPLLAAIRRYKPLSVGVIRSWDNLSAKGVLGARFNRLVVWNSMMLDELLHYYDEYQPRDVLISGASPFDVYYEESLRNGKKDLTQIGLQPDRPVISFMLGYPDLFAGIEDHVKMLCSAVENNRFCEPVQLVLRLQPGPRSDSLRSYLKQYQHVATVDDPNQSLFEGYRMGGWKAYRSDVYWYGRLVRNSRVVVNYVSTTTIDAALFDVPNVSIAFDGYSDLPYERSNRRYLDRTHYQWVRSCGGNRLAFNETELVDVINAYLKDPAQQREGRNEIVRSLCGRFDGRCGARTAEFVLETLGIPS